MEEQTLGERQGKWIVRGIPLLTLLAGAIFGRAVSRYLPFDLGVTMFIGAIVWGLLGFQYARTFKRDVTSRQGDRIRCPGDAARMVMERLRYEVKEHVLTLLLSAKGKVLGIEEVFVGSASQATVHPREIFETALHHHASALILVHNHPSGDPMPSRPDIRLTERLAQVGGLMDIPLADHIIIGDGIYYSFKDADQL